MNRIILWTCTIIAVNLGACTTCNPETQPPDNHTDGSIDSAADGNGQADGDLGAKLPGDASGGQADVASVDEAVADGSGGDTDQVQPDAADTGDTSDAVVGPPVPPTSECGEGMMSAPKPGDPCDIVGVTRCSDVESKWQGGLILSATEKKYCIQPNLLRCVESAPAKPKWQIEPCPAPAPSCAQLPAKAVMTCQEAVGQAVCAVAYGSQFDPLAGKLTPCSAVSLANGTTGCGGMGPIHKCATIVTAKPAPDTSWVQAELDKYAFLKSCCPNCRYWFPYKTCPDMNIGLCWGWDNPEQFGIKIQPVCLENIPGKPPTCVTTCEDLKYSAEFGKPPG